MDRKILNIISAIAEIIPDLHHEIENNAISLHSKSHTEKDETYTVPLIPFLRERTDIELCDTEIYVSEKELNFILYNLRKLQVGKEGQYE